MICLSWWALSILILRTQCRFISSLPSVLNILLMKKTSDLGGVGRSRGHSPRFLDLDNSILFPEKVLVFMLWRSLEPRNVNKETCFWNPSRVTNIVFAKKVPASWNHALALKKKKKEPHDSSCVKCMSHTYINTSSLWRPTSRLGDHYLSTRLLTLVFQHFQKFARKCLPVPGSP